MTFGKIAIIGPGLLGGSIALALRDRSLAGEFALYGRRPQSLAGAAEHGMEAYCSTDLGTVVRGADLCVLATPVGAMPQLLAAALPELPPGAIVTDVGSVKGQLVHELEALCHAAGAERKVRFVGSHPMAGSEQTGFQAARADLFEGSTCFITPTPATEPEALARIAEFWQAVGCRVAQVSPEAHDPVVARISHVPHLLASLLVNLVADRENGLAEMAHCGGGFRDSTRIAGGSPSMWREILLENGTAVEAALSELATHLEQARQFIATENEAALEELLTRAKVSRDSLKA